MGGVVSDARSNSDLIQNLVQSGYLASSLNKEIEILYIVDRGRFLCNFENQAYENRSWRTEDFYLAPISLYCDVLKSLALKKSHSVLNINSGIGYFGLIASGLVGYQGKFIGVSHDSRTTHYAATRHQNFVHRATTFDMQEFSEPIYLTGDILKFKPGFAKFDRVFCDATVTVDVLPFFCTFLKIGGILVVAVDEHLLELKMLDEKRFLTRILSYVQMPSLMTDNGSIYDIYPKSPPASDLFKASDTVILEYCLENVPNLFPDSIEQKMWLKFEEDLQLKPQPLKKLCRGVLRKAIRARFESCDEGRDLKKQYFAENFMTNFQYELQRIQITHLSLTNCCLKRNNFSRTFTSKLNCKFKDYRKAFEVDGLENLKANPKKELCERCRVLDQLTLIELMDDEYLRTSNLGSYFRTAIQDRVLSLPLPRSLRRFLNYNRTFDLNQENFYSPVEI